MSNTCEALDNANISPVRPKSKHTSTPLRTRRKTSRRDQGLDVHTTVSTSTPTVHRSPRLQRPRQDSPQLINSNYNSPSSSFPCSQDGRPDVVWDFTSPKLPKGSRKKELKMTVQELLANLNQCQAAECDSKSNPYIKLLEDYMSKQPAEVTVKKIKNQRKDVKKRSRHRIEELTKFIASIEKSKNDNNSPSHSRSPMEGNKNAADGSLLEQSTSFKNSFLDGGKSEDSSEELWGDVDNSFIVKATQELEKVNVVPTTTSNHVVEIVSTIPETIPNPPVPKNSSPAIESRKRLCEEHADILLHLSNIDWDVDGDEEWDNGFLLEDDDLSLIPENVLSGESPIQMPINSRHSVGDATVAASVASDGGNICCVDKTESDTLLEKTELDVNFLNVPNNELYNSFEDENFEEESLLCQPEVLSKLDEVESMLLSQPKCTPEEIKKKKDEALKRRKLKRKN